MMMVVVDRSCIGNGKRADNAVTVLCKCAIERLSIVIQILQLLFTNLTVSLKHAPKGNAVTNNDELCSTCVCIIVLSEDLESNLAAFKVNLFE